MLLATVEDLHSRRMVGSATSEHYPTAEPAKDAINTAVATRGGDVEGVISHSDKGPQHTSKAFAAACTRLGINRSTGRTGNALNNAPAESFFPTHTHEPINRRAWATKTSARQEISPWVHTWHNQQRLHSTIGTVPRQHTNKPTPPNHKPNPPRLEGKLSTPRRGYAARTAKGRSWRLRSLVEDCSHIRETSCTSASTDLTTPAASCPDT